MNKDLKVIKKHYGEKMMHLCRELFPTLLVNTNNPRIPEIKNNKIFCNLFSFLLKKNNKITIVINNKYPMKFFNIL